MKNLLNRIFFYSIYFLVSLSAQAEQSAVQSIDKPYDRAVVFIGGGLQFAQFVGELEGAHELGKDPDLIIASCGGSMAAGLVLAFPNPEELRNYILSKDFYQLMKGIRVHPWFQDFFQEAMFFGSLLHLVYANKIADIFSPSHAVLDLPLDLPVPGFGQLMNSGSDKISVVMTGAKVLYTAADVNQSRGDRKLFKEVYFTNSKTAPYLQGFKAPIFKLDERAAISNETEVMTDVTINDSVRAAITGPFYMAPKKIGNQLYVGGTADFLPIEVAGALAHEVIMGYTEEFSPHTDEKGTEAIYHYDINKRIRSVHDRYADYWVDFSDRTKMTEGAGFDPTHSVLSMEMQVPDSYDEYMNRVRIQMEYGKSRTIEALTRSVLNDKSHIRNMNELNASKRLRRRYGK